MIKIFAKAQCKTSSAHGPARKRASMHPRWKEEPGGQSGQGGKLRRKRTEAYPVTAPCDPQQRRDTCRCSSYGMHYAATGILHKGKKDSRTQCQRAFKAL
eukprot:3434434-Amphidinium_carterae.2